LLDSTGRIENQAKNEFYILSQNRWAVRENNQFLKDLLRTCVLDHLGVWDEILSLVEFSYNNSYYASIGMAPYEDLYERKVSNSIVSVPR